MGLDIFLTKKKRTNIGYFRKVNFLVKFFEDKGFDVPNQTPASNYEGRCRRIAF